MDYYFKRFGNSDQPMPIIVEANDVNELENMLETDNQIVYVVIPQDSHPVMFAQAYCISGSRTISENPYLIPCLSAHNNILFPLTLTLRHGL